MLKRPILKGTCLCDAVRIEVKGELEHQPEACHCSNCRKQSGHVLAAVNVRRTSLTGHGEDKVTWYLSSDKVRRGFCAVCGSTLFWYPLMECYEFTAVAMGVFDGPTGASIPSWGRRGIIMRLAMGLSGVRGIDWVRDWVKVGFEMRKVTALSRHLFLWAYTNGCI